jgi:hypothetical protein
MYNNINNKNNNNSNNSVNTNNNVLIKFPLLESLQQLKSLTSTDKYIACNKTSNVLNKKKLNNNNSNNKLLMFPNSQRLITDTAQNMKK